MVDPTSAVEPFLSVIMRTQGRRPTEMRESLLCLAAQTHTDFEVIVVGHDLTDHQEALVAEIVDDAMPWLRARMTVITVTGGTRAHPLNAGFDTARGRYCVALDDDDLVFAHWVETFAQHETDADGRLIRTRCVWQEHQVTDLHDVAATTAVGPTVLLHDEPFSLVRHVLSNETPFMSVAYPRSLHASGVVRFDDELTTLEDWDYLLHAASLVGVIDVPEVTSVYRRWVNAENSLATHSEQEWADNLARFERTLDSRPVLLAAGETAVLRRMLTAAGNDASAESRRRVDTETIRAEALALVQSRSWRLSSPLRTLASLVGRGTAVNAQDVLAADRAQLLTIIDAIRTSRSWYLARALRPSADRD